MKTHIFDIETAPLSDDELRKILPPFDESPFRTYEFDPSRVKLGNMKDQAKIDAKVNVARAEHKAAMEQMSAKCEEAREQHWRDFVSGAALSAVTGRVLCVTYMDPSGEIRIDHGDGDERAILDGFWHYHERCVHRNERMAGLNIFGFDLPFLVRRSWILSVLVPRGVLSWWKNRPNWSDVFIDLRIVWLLGEYPASRKSNFGELAAAFRTGGKLEGVTGADFARLWQEDRETAIKYAIEDVAQPATWLLSMQLDEPPRPATARGRTEKPKAEADRPTPAITPLTEEEIVEI